MTDISHTLHFAYHSRIIHPSMHSAASKHDASSPLPPSSPSSYDFAAAAGTIVPHLAASAAHFASNQHLLHTSEERSGSESPTEVSSGLRKMSITADTWCSNLVMDGWKSTQRSDLQHSTSVHTAAPFTTTNKNINDTRTNNENTQNTASGLPAHDFNPRPYSSSPSTHSLIASLPPHSPSYVQPAPAGPVVDIMQLQTQALLERSISAPTPKDESPPSSHFSQSHVYPLHAFPSHSHRDTTLDVTKQQPPVIPQELPVQILPQSATFLQPLHSFRPPLSRGGSVDRCQSSGMSACTSVSSSTTASSRNSPRNGAVSAQSMRESSTSSNFASGSSMSKQALSAPVSNTVSKSNSHKELASLDRFIEISPSMRGIQESELENQSPCVVNAHFDCASAHTSTTVPPSPVPTSAESATRSIVPLESGSGSVGPSSQGSSPVQELVSPSTSHNSTSSSLSAKERNARYKRSRATLEQEDDSREKGSNTQLKTSSSASASSANGEALAAAAAAAAAAAIAAHSATTQHQHSGVLASAPTLTRSNSAPPPQALHADVPTSAPSSTSSTHSSVAVSSNASHSVASTHSVPPPTLAPNTPKRQALISVLSCVLTQLFSNPSDRLPSDPRLLTRFHTERMPSISIGKYLERIAHYSECSDEALVMAFIHISRISHNKPTFHLNALSIHRLLLTSIMCTVKYFDDSYYNNSFYSKIGGVALREINHLEIDFLELIQFELYIDTRVYVRFYEELANPVLHPHCSCGFQKMVALNLQEIENPPQI